MAVIKLVENYAVQSLRSDVRDSLMMAGEQSVLLQLFHPGDHDAIPCPQCGDDIYKSPEGDCTVCYGTMWLGGVRAAMKVWALYSDQDKPEKLSNRGDYQPDFREVQFEAFPLVTEHDVIVRVEQWASDGTVEALKGFYILQQVNRRSLRTGYRYGQTAADVVAQKAQCSELSGTVKMIENYPICGQTFTESMSLTPGSITVPAENLINPGTTRLLSETGSTPSGLVVAPDAKVVYFPFEAAPGGVVPDLGTGAMYAAYIGDGVKTVIPVMHDLHTTDVSVTVYVVATGEEISPDVFHANLDVVNLGFASAPATSSLRVVVQTQEPT